MDGLQRQNQCELGVGELLWMAGVIIMSFSGPVGVVDSNSQIFGN